MNYKIRSKVGKVSVVHHDHLKVSQIPFGNGQVVPQTPESGDIQVVQNVPEPRPERRNDENGEVVSLVAKCSAARSGWLQLRYSIQKMCFKFLRTKKRKRGIV